MTKTIRWMESKRWRKPKGNQEWTIQRNGQHWIRKTQDEDKQNKTKTQKTKKMSNTDTTKKKNWAEPRRPKIGFNVISAKSKIVVSYFDKLGELKCSVLRRIDLSF